MKTLGSFSQLTQSFFMTYRGQISELDFMDFYALPGTLFLSDLEKIHLYK